jgi:hypothetical protein
MTPRQRISVDNVVALAIAAGADDFAIRQKLGAAFAELPFAKIVAALARGRQRAELRQRCRPGPDEDIEFRTWVAVLQTRGPEVLHRMLDRLGAEYTLRTPIERLVRQFAGGDPP